MTRHPQGCPLKRAIASASFRALVIAGIAAICMTTITSSALAADSPAPGTRPLTFADLMRFRQIEEPVISKDGRWVAYSLVPDRGDAELVVQAVGSRISYQVERGRRPALSADGLWLAAAVSPSLQELETHRLQRSRAKQTTSGSPEPDRGSNPEVSTGSCGEDDSDDTAPSDGLALVDLRDGTVVQVPRVREYVFSEDGRWLAYLRCREPVTQPEGEPETQPEIQPEGKPPGPPEPSPAPLGDGPETPDDTRDRARLGTTLHLRRLADSTEIVIPWVATLAFNDSGSLLAYAISAPEGRGNGVFLRRLRVEETPEVMLRQAADLLVGQLLWAHDRDRLALVSAPRNEAGEPGSAEIWLWTSETGLGRLVSDADAPEGQAVSYDARLSFSRDGERLFFGFAPPRLGATEAVKGSGSSAAEPTSDPLSIEQILADRKVDVWHPDDPRIVPNQKQRWKEHERTRSYLAVVHLGESRTVALADADLPDVAPTDNPLVTLGRAPGPYLKELTWDGEYSDLVAVNLVSGVRRMIAERLAAEATLSPDGRFILYYDAEAWHLNDLRENRTIDVTSGLGVPFADEDHDYPSPPPGYGQSEWLADSSAVLIYDKYDIWQIFTDGHPPRCVTGGQGRRRQIVFRIIDLDPDEEVLPTGATLLLEAYHDREKYDAFYSVRLGQSLPQPLYETGRHRLEVLAKAEEVDRILFTRERYDEFPDLWIAGLDLADPERLSDANPQIADLAWGEAELVEWTSLDGAPLQGVLIKPAGYQPGTRYPVLVYIYRLMSDRLNLFNEPVVNHRPSFPLYASNGYAIFLPDIRFEIGRPGLSAVKCVVPGVQKLVDIGIADPAAIGLHGHSWGGYLTAYAITQTDYFAAAVAGAPVANMTSAYSGIRRASGLARQLQYEREQSRLGGSLWEVPELYLAGSPVLLADRIHTPLLIEFGDTDGAVPFEQGVELYLACRRLGKSCILLQYRDEPHHLKQYADKLDYSIKMKEFFDHYLKGAPAPAWMAEGVPYAGK